LIAALALATTVGCGPGGRRPAAPIDGARELLSRGDVDRARAALERILRGDPEEAGAHRLLARLALDNDQWAIAKDHLDWILRREPRDEEALYLMTRLDERQGRHFKALTGLRILVREGSSLPFVYRDLARDLRQERRHLEATMLLLRGLELSRPSGSLVEEAATGWKKLRHPEQALALWESGAADDAATVPSLFQRAFLRQTLRDFEGASGAYDSLLARAPDHPHALYNAALVRRSKGDQEGAAVYLETLIASSPGFEMAYAELARVYLTLGWNELARGVLQDLLEIGDDRELLDLAQEALDRMDGRAADGADALPGPSSEEYGSSGSETELGP